MKANLGKRAVCYILDSLIVAIICVIISLVVPKSIEYISVQNDISILNESYLNSEISFSEYFDQYSMLIKDMDQNNLLYVSCCFVFTFIYFIIIPLFLNGITVGMLICKLKLKRKNQSLFMVVFIRGVVAYGVLYYPLGLAVLLIPGNLYFMVLTILAIIQILVVISSVFMIKYRNDKRSLADILSSSNILIES